MLSELNDCATSGALPPRIAATILSSFVPPTTLTWIPGCLASKSRTTALRVWSSGSTNGVHIVMFAGPAFVPLAESLDPPQAVTVKASASSSVTISTRVIRSSSIW